MRTIVGGALPGAVLAFAVAAPAFAQVPASTQLNVQITINAECVLGTPDTLEFADAGVLASEVQGSSTIEVTCTGGTNYQLGLGPGSGAGATVAARYLTSGTGTIEYSLYQDAACNSVWGNTEGMMVPGAGSGTTQQHTVYGCIPPQASPSPGLYTDVVTVTVQY